MTYTFRNSQKRFELYGLKANLQLADAENMPFDDNSFDAVYSFGVIHHTPNIQKTIEETYRILKPGGQAIISVYNRNSAHYYFCSYG
ncbi:MAG: class I SAM-dependent methyltransferase [Ignavibacteria bacterium]|nr:class I SAM-dependent methyltransferase [Ignavibacteria bacterium]